MNVNNNSIVTTPGASEPQGSAVVSGVALSGGPIVAGSLRSLSCDREGAGVARQAPVSQSITSAEAVPTDNLERLQKSATQANRGTEQSEGNHEAVPKKVVNITNLSEEQLLLMLQSYINCMTTFANKTRNVHKELKENLEKTGKVFAQYAKVLNASKKTPQVAKESNNTCIKKDSACTSNVCNQIITELQGKVQDALTEMQQNQQEQYQLIQDQLKDIRQEQLKQQMLSQQQEQGPQKQETINKWPKRQNQQQTKRKKPAKKMPKENAKEQNEPKSSREADVNQEWTTVARKTPAVRRLPTSKPAAVLVKLSEGVSYADTVRAIRGTDIDLAAVGTKVTAMRKTKNGDLLVELTKGRKAAAASQPLQQALAERLGDRAAAVTRLCQQVDLEVVDLDAAATVEEVADAIRSAIAGANEDPTVTAQLRDVQVTGLWPTRSGQQVATVRVLRSATAGLTHVRIGWLQCRARPRRPEPARCFRCHGYGHTSRDCRGPDLSAACRRCGEAGHKAAACTKGQDRCVACERIGAKKMAHRPGSGACSARKTAMDAESPKPAK